MLFDCTYDLISHANLPHTKHEAIEQIILVSQLMYIGTSHACPDFKS